VKKQRPVYLQLNPIKFSPSRYSRPILHRITGVWPVFCFECCDLGVGGFQYLHQNGFGDVDQQLNGWVGQIYRGSVPSQH